MFSLCCNSLHYLYDFCLRIFCFCLYAYVILFFKKIYFINHLFIYLFIFAFQECNLLYFMLKGKKLKWQTYCWLFSKRNLGKRKKKLGYSSFCKFFSPLVNHIIFFPCCEFLKYICFHSFEKCERKGNFILESIKVEKDGMLCCFTCRMHIICNVKFSVG